MRAKMQEKKKRNTHRIPMDMLAEMICTSTCCVIVVQYILCFHWLGCVALLCQCLVSFRILCLFFFSSAQKTLEIIRKRRRNMQRNKYCYSKVNSIICISVVRWGAFYTLVIFALSANNFMSDLLNGQPAS